VSQFWKGVLASQLKCAFLLLCLLLASCQTSSDEAVNNSKQQFPRLFFDSSEEVAIKERINRDPLLNGAFKKLLKIADEMLTLAPVSRVVEGRRMLAASRICLKRVHYLSFAFKMTGNKEYLKKAQIEMLAAASFDNWNPSHFLDVAEMTAALGIGFDLLYNDISPDVRTIIRTAIVEKGLKPGLADAWWVKCKINWNQVCHTGLVIGALAVMDVEPEIADRIITRAVENVPLAMGIYKPEGTYAEGPGYWNYGTTYNVLLIAALESALKSDFGLLKQPGFLKTSEYYLHTTGPTGLFFNYSDCGTSSSVSPAQYWFSAKCSDPTLLWNERKKLAAYIQKEDLTGSSYLPLLFIWSTSFNENQSKPSKLHMRGSGENPIGVHRSGWGKDATYVAIKGGTPGASHAHMDIGSFVIDAQGVRWAEDLGMQRYHSLESKGVDLWNKEQDSQRWDVFRLNNSSHNTLVVDGKKQRVSGNAPIVSFSENSSRSHTVIDFTMVYKNQLKDAKRGVALLKDKSVLIQDEFKAASDGTVRWGMLTRAEVEVVSDHVVLLKKDGKEMTLKILAPQNAMFEIVDTAKPRQKYDVPNPGTRMIVFKVKCKKGQATQFSVWLTPESSSENPPLQPFSAWK
jgi:hypothetical protein